MLSCDDTLFVTLRDGQGRPLIGDIEMSARLWFDTDGDLMIVETNEFWTNAGEASIDSTNAIEMAVIAAARAAIADPTTAVAEWLRETFEQAPERPDYTHPCARSIAGL